MAPKSPEVPARSVQSQPPSALTEIIPENVNRIPPKAVVQSQESTSTKIIPETPTDRYSLSRHNSTVIFSILYCNFVFSVLLQKVLELGTSRQIQMFSRVRRMWLFPYLLTRKLWVHRRCQMKTRTSLKKIFSYLSRFYASETTSISLQI